MKRISYLVQYIFFGFQSTAKSFKTSLSKSFNLLAFGPISTNFGMESNFNIIVLPMMTHTVSFWTIYSTDRNLNIWGKFNQGSNCDIIRNLQENRKQPILNSCQQPFAQAGYQHQKCSNKHFEGLTMEIAATICTGWIQTSATPN